MKTSNLHFHVYTNQSHRRIALIDSFQSYQEALQAIQEYEHEDKQTGLYWMNQYTIEATAEAIELLADLQPISNALYTDPTTTLDDLIPPGRVLYTMLDGEHSLVYYRRGLARVNRLDLMHGIDL